MNGIKLPESNSINGIQFFGDDGLGISSYARISYAGLPSILSVKEIADIVAKFVEAQIGVAQETDTGVADISIFTVREAVSKNPSYRVFSDKDPGNGTVVYVRTIASCAYDKKTLESFVREARDHIK